MSEEANSFTVEEYERMVSEVREATKDSKSLAQGHKRVQPTARDIEHEDDAELQNVLDELVVELEKRKVDL